MRCDPTERFSRRVEHYVKSRPPYPAGIIEKLTGAANLSPADVIADVGSGTGKLSELFLKNGNRVIGIEPNGPMREAGRRLLEGYSGFSCVEGRAESTTLQDGSVDIITAGQAFHWFDVEKARREFSRVLAPGGRIVLVWNNRLDAASPFMRAYEMMLRTYGTDYDEVNHHRLTDEEIGAFLGDGYAVSVHANRHDLDLDGFRSRVLSCSYVPAEGEPGYDGMLDETARIFSAHHENGKVRFQYETRMYYTPGGGRDK